MSGDAVVETGSASWFSSDGPSDSGPAGWRLDVVTLLAVIGESSIADNSQTITATVLCLLPRIIPAPQALLRGTRPSRLPDRPAHMTGVVSGVSVDTVGFFANIIHPLDDLKKFEFKMLRITHAAMPDKAAAKGKKGFGFLGRGDKGSARTPSSGNQLNANNANTSQDIEMGTSSVDGSSEQKMSPTNPPRPGNLDRKPTVRQTLTKVINTGRPAVPAALWSPVHILTVFSTLLTAGIIIMTAIMGDGTAIIAVVLVAMVSSFVGWASWWTPILQGRRGRSDKVPPGDVVIRTREGGFLLVRCTEEVARELYSGTDECSYHIKSEKLYRSLMGLSTVLLMVSVIMLGNCKWWSQVFIGASYIVLNGLYWGMGLLPTRMFWDLSRYKCEIITPEDSENAEETYQVDSHDPEQNPSFTRTLWYVIRETRSTGWVERNGAAPGTAKWKRWLAEAEENARNENRGWKAVTMKDDIMAMSDDQLKSYLQNHSPEPKRADYDPSKAYDPAEDYDPAPEAAPSVGVPFSGSAPNPNPKTL